MESYKGVSDILLVQRLKEDGARALSEIYFRYWDRLLLVAVNLLDHAEEAEECVQNVFMSLWNRRETLQLTHSLHTYLAVSVKYQCLTVMARRHRERAKEVASHMSYHSDSPEHAYIAKELQQRIEQSILRLPAQCRLVFELRRDQGKSNKEIAKELGIAENTVKMHLKRAHKKLRDDLLSVFVPLVCLFLKP